MLPPENNIVLYKKSW